jgi:hypothetical protein
MIVPLFSNTGGSRYLAVGVRCLAGWLAIYWISVVDWLVAGRPLLHIAWNDISLHCIDVSDFPLYLKLTLSSMIYYIWNTIEKCICAPLLKDVMNCGLMYVLYYVCGLCRSCELILLCVAFSPYLADEICSPSRLSKTFRHFKNTPSICGLFFCCLGMTYRNNFPRGIPPPPTLAARTCHHNIALPLCSALKQIWWTYFMLCIG